MASPIHTPDGRRVATPVIASPDDDDDDDDGPPALAPHSDSDRDSERPTLRGAESGSDTEVEEAPDHTRSSRIVTWSLLRNLDAQFGRVSNGRAGPWMSSAFHRLASEAGRDMETFLAADSLEEEAPDFGTQGEDTPLTPSLRDPEPASSSICAMGERRYGASPSDVILRMSYDAVTIGSCKLHEDCNRRVREKGASSSSSSSRNEYMPPQRVNEYMTECTRSAAPRARNSHWFGFRGRGPSSWAAQMAMLQFTLIKAGATLDRLRESASSSTGCGSPTQTSPINLNEMD